MQNVGGKHASRAGNMNKCLIPGGAETLLNVCLWVLAAVKSRPSFCQNNCAAVVL